MNIKSNNLIIRIDDRLIHGQVIVGWVKALNLNKLIVANNQLMKDNLKMQMVKLAVPPDISVEFLTIKEAIAAYKDNKWNRQAGILLLESPKDAYNFVAKGCIVEKINVGGLHIRNKREQVTQNIALDDEDRYYLKKLLEQHVDLEGRALPSDEEYKIEKILIKS